MKFIRSAMCVHPTGIGVSSFRTYCRGCWSMSATVDIMFRLNGVERRVTVPAEMSALEMLRDRIGLTGTKYACGEGESLRRSFTKYGAVQCGFCTPGLMVQASHLLETHPHANRAEIQRGIEGNLCRCTGYKKIIDAIAAAEIDAA